MKISNDQAFVKLFCRRCDMVWTTLSYTIEMVFDNTRGKKQRTDHNHDNRADCNLQISHSMHDSSLSCLPISDFTLRLNLPSFGGSPHSFCYSENIGWNLRIFRSSGLSLFWRKGLSLTSRPSLLGALCEEFLDSRNSHRINIFGLNSLFLIVLARKYQPKSLKNMVPDTGWGI